MTPNEFSDYLRELQKNPYNWPNDYFAWEKPDGSLFMVGISSGLIYHILKHELEEDRRSELEKLKQDLGLEGDLVYQREYKSYQYSISPTFVHMHHVDDGPLVRYDPVEKLINEISGYQYLGTWRDPDVLMDTPYGFSRTLAHGRWGLAKEHILNPQKVLSSDEQGPGSLDDMLHDAHNRKGTKRMSDEDHCLVEALEENDMLHVSLDLARRVVQQMGNGILFDEDGEPFRKAVLKNHPEWTFWGAFELGEILYNDYSSRLYMLKQSNNIEHER